MAIPTPPRSVSDATRFTSTTPHAMNAAAAAAFRRAKVNTAQAAYASSSSSSSKNNQRFQKPTGSTSTPGATSRSGQSPPKVVRPPPAGSTGGSANVAFSGETPEQKVARLRAAHQAAKNAKVSSLDRIIGGTRRIFDNAHRITIISLIGFTGESSVSAI